MFITIHQPEFMPWSAFFEKMARTDHFVILDSVKFQKNYFDNRCRIKQNGQANWLTVPVRKGGSDEAICETRVSEDLTWGKKCFHALYYNYRPAPFWAEHEPFLDRVLNQTRWERLIDLNMEVLSYVASSLDLDFVYTRSSTMDLSAKGSELVLKICLKMGAGRYLSGQHGQDYLDLDAFARAGIDVVFQDYAEIPYEQFNGPYVGPLSIFDMLLNLGPEARQWIDAGRKV